MITYEKIFIMYIIAKYWTTIMKTINSIITFLSLHKSSGFYSMRILQGKDECFIIIFITY